MCSVMYKVKCWIVFFFKFFLFWNTQSWKKFYNSKLHALGTLKSTILSIFLAIFTRWVIHSRTCVSPWFSFQDNSLSWRPWGALPSTAIKIHVRNNIWKLLSAGSDSPVGSPSFYTSSNNTTAGAHFAFANVRKWVFDVACRFEHMSLGL